MYSPAMLRFALMCLLIGSFLAIPVRATAQCAGDCSVEDSTDPKTLEVYAKRASKAVLDCAKDGDPGCPTACPLPDPAESGLSPACGDLLACQIRAMAETALAAAWDDAGSCAMSAADDCQLARAKAAGKLAAKRLKRRRTGTMDKLANDAQSCATSADKPGACDGATLCAQVSDWVEGIMPTAVRPGRIQTLEFTAAVAGEGAATLTLSSEASDWGLYGAESIVLEYDVDGQALGTIVVHNGEAATDYRILLGDLSAGDHTIGLRHSKTLSPASTSAGVIHASAQASVLAPSDPGYDALRFAPVLLGLDDDLNVFSSHPGNAVSDVPVVTYVRAIPQSGMTTYRYVMIWSNEDGGTGLFPNVLMAQYGRTTDIEGYVEVDVSDLGVLEEVRFRPDESGILPVFAGGFLGTHPIVRTSTANGLVEDDGDSRLRFALAPFEFDDSGLPRERGMDLDPVSYVAMAKEMIRETKIEVPTRTNTLALGDPRDYLFVEYELDVDVPGDVLYAYAVVGGTTYRSDHFTPSGGGALSRNKSGGFSRTTVELPGGTAVTDVTELGMAGLIGAGSMSGTLYQLDAFMLGADFLPGAHLLFSGAQFDSGLGPVWSVTP